MVRVAAKLGLIAGVAAALVASLVWFAASAGESRQALQDFDRRLIPAIGVLIVADYVVRFGRWRWLMRRATGVKLSLGQDLALFFAGAALVLTPGRSGEWVRSVYARRLHALPVAQTAPIPLLERLVDVAAMLLLAGCGAIAVTGVSTALLVGATLLGGGLTGLAVARGRLLALIWRRLNSTRLTTALAGSGRLFGIGVVAASFALGLLAWAIECAAFCLVLSGLGVHLTAGALGKALLIYPIATLAGTVSFLPGGLGVTEGGIAGMLRTLLAVEAGAASAAALLIRVAIIGPGVIAGLTPLLLLGRESLRAEGPTTSASEEPVASTA